jgi:hypothetical protein
MGRNHDRHRHHPGHLRHPKEHQMSIEEIEASAELIAHYASGYDTEEL